MRARRSGALRKIGLLKEQYFKRYKRSLKKRKKPLFSHLILTPVTQEIERGPNASNQSGTLKSYGNLYTFIGFMAGSTPVRPIKKTFIKKNHTLKGSLKEYLLKARTE